MDNKTDKMMGEFIDKCRELGMGDKEIVCLYAEAITTDESEDDWFSKKYKDKIEESDKLAAQGMDAPHIQEYFAKMREKYGDDFLK